MNPKIEKLDRAIEENKAKISQLQEKVERMAEEKTKLENAEYIDACRSHHLSLAELYAFLESRQLSLEPDDTAGEETEDVNED